MCGRFSFSPLAKIIEDRFDVKVDKTRYKPRYNSAPSQDLAVISNSNPGELDFYRWGLKPFWAKDKSIGNKLINAKAETIAEKPSFKNSLKWRRCLVLSDGFYEWKTMNKKEKIPYRITIGDNNLFAMAGIWGSWKDETGLTINSFAIITTSPNKLMENIHSRMPVILSPNDEKLWLSNDDTTLLQSLLRPFPEKEMTAFPVSNLVNSPANDKQEVMNPVEYLL
ncbi:MAG: SOS response-associated peptidase [Deltaproteobacteria bacterium]|nr:MAG: SOS response-associated peptidase [Deltaproteobacteria bacterium]